jgi:hypothetical protein
MEGLPGTSMVENISDEKIKCLKTCLNKIAHEPSDMHDGFCRSEQYPKHFNF